MTIEIEVTAVPPIVLEVATVGTQGPVGAGGGGSSAWADITGKPSTFPPSTHTHDDRYYTESEMDAFLAAKAAASHTHTIANVTGLQAALDSKATGSDAVNVSGNQTIDGVKTFTSSPVIPDASFAIAKIVGLQAGLDAKSDTSHVHDSRYYTESETDILLAAKVGPSHSHTIADVTSLQATLDAKALDNAVVKLTGNQTVAGIKTYSSSPVVPDSSFTIAKVTGLQTALDAKAALSHNHDTLYYTESETDTLLAGKAATSHTHTISNVTALQAALDAKSDTSHTHTYASLTGKPTLPLSVNTKKASNTALTGTTFADVGEMSVTLPIGDYDVEVQVIYDATTANDIKFQLAFTGTATCNIQTGPYFGSGGTAFTTSTLLTNVSTTLNYASLTGFGGNIFCGGLGIGTYMVVKYTGRAYVTAAGNFKLQAARNANTDATDSNVVVGSYVSAVEVTSSP